MKNPVWVMFAVTGLVALLSPGVWADPVVGSPTVTHFSGNQLQQGSTQWYEKPATLVGPAQEIGAKGGRLLVLQTGSVLYMEGDSTLHKYQMNANALLGSAVVKAREDEDLLKALQAGRAGSIVLTIPVVNFKSREKGLDDNADKALKAVENPNIQFVLKSESLKAGKEMGSNLLTAIGNLTVAGTSIPVTLSGDAVIQGERVEFKGVQNLKMSDFKITPPSVSILIVSITCKDEITVHYDVIFGPKNKSRTETKK